MGRTAPLGYICHTTATSRMYTVVHIHHEVQAEFCEQAIVDSQTLESKVDLCSKQIGRNMLLSTPNENFLATDVKSWSNLKQFGVLRLTVCH